MPKIPDKWVKIPDTLVRHVWRCPKCKATESCGPSDYAEVGVPECSDCGEAAVFVCTEFNSGRHMRLLLARMWRKLGGKKAKDEKHAKGT